MPKQTLNKESFAVFKMKDTASFFAQLKKKIQLIFKLLAILFYNVLIKKHSLLTLYICCIVLIFTKDNLLIPKTIQLKDLAFLSKYPGQVYVTENPSFIQISMLVVFLNSPHQ